MNNNLTLFFLSYIFFIILSGCHTAEMVQGPDGSWYETGRQVAYPNYEVVRNQKSIQFPESLQIQLVAYREKHGFWPYSVEGFALDSKKNQIAIRNLSNQGYSDVLFINQTDTLNIYFKFEKLYKVKHHEADDNNTRAKYIPGLWKYYLQPDGKFGLERKLYVKYYR